VLVLNLKDSPITFERLTDGGAKLCLRFVDWMKHGETMLASMPDPDRHPFQLTLQLKFGEWVEPLPGLRLKLYDRRGRVAIDAPREIRITRAAK